MRTAIRCAAITLASAVILSGCGSGKSPIGPIMAHRHPPPAKKPVANGPTPPADMVGAVGDARPGSARVSVRFDLRTRPQVAQPMDLNVVILPSAGLDRVSGKVEADDGLEILSGADIAPTDRPTEDVPISHSIRVVPRREGVLTLRAVVSAESGGVPSSQTFSIPLIATAAEGAAGQASQDSAGTEAPDTPASPAQTPPATSQ
ncbi:MAG: hypothetical protein WBE65_02555 [Steroidobacteraceae bacterium]